MGGSAAARGKRFPGSIAISWSTLGMMRESSSILRPARCCPWCWGSASVRARARVTPDCFLERAAPVEARRARAAACTQQRRPHVGAQPRAAQGQPAARAAARSARSGSSAGGTPSGGTGGATWRWRRRNAERWSVRRRSPGGSGGTGTGGGSGAAGESGGGASVPLLISQIETRGPAGAADEFIEIWPIRLMRRSPSIFELVDHGARRRHHWWLHARPQWWSPRYTGNGQSIPSARPSFDHGHGQHVRRNSRFWTASSLVSSRDAGCTLRRTARTSSTRSASTTARSRGGGARNLPGNRLHLRRQSA